MTSLRITPLLCVALIIARQGLSAQGERPAEQVYKNIQVLKGVPTSTFMNTMFFQRYALGVSCNFCHVGSEWEKDDKPQKRKAREMLQMVFDINKRHFGGDNAVNCMTCHNGSAKPTNDIAAVRVGVQDMLRPRPTAPATPSLPSVDEILTRYIAALGGAEALSKVQTRITKGNMITADGAIVPFEDTYATAPASWLSVRRFGGTLGDFKTGFDGQAGWNSDNRGVTEQQGEARMQLQMNAAFENRLAIRDLYTEWRVAGLENVGSAPAMVLGAVSAITGRHERLFFDAGTGLLVRRSVATQSLFGSFATDTYFENYRMIDGVAVPTMVSEFTPDFGTIRKATTVETNAKIDRSIFAKPHP